MMGCCASADRKEGQAELEQLAATSKAQEAANASALPQSL